VLRRLIAHVGIAVIIGPVAIGVMVGVLILGIRAVVARAIVVALKCRTCEMS
jgi:hypothetical protein